jgi:hypothetical protein
MVPFLCVVKGSAAEVGGNRSNGNTRARIHREPIVHSKPLASKVFLVRNGQILGRGFSAGMCRAATNSPNAIPMQEGFVVGCWESRHSSQFTDLLVTNHPHSEFQTQRRPKSSRLRARHFGSGGVLRHSLHASCAVRATGRGVGGGASRIKQCVPNGMTCPHSLVGDQS